MAKIERVETVTDERTGEVLSSTSNVVQISRLPAEPPYIKLYIEDMARFYGITQSSYQSILLYVAACVAYDGVVSISARRKAQIALTTGISVKTINNAITVFVKEEILRRVGRAEYELNPHLFAKGEWSEVRRRREAFTFTTVYDPNAGRRIVSTQRLSDDERSRQVLEQQGQARLCD